MTDRVAILRRRAQLLASIREYFASQSVLETTTSVNSCYAVTDPAIESFKLDTDKPRYLRTSPEYALKRLLSEGAPDLFELGPVFRKGESGQRHNPEFTMLEWYRLDFSMQQLIEDVLRLLSYVSNGALQPEQVPQFTYADIFERELGVEIHAVSAVELAQLARHRGNPPDCEMDRDQWLDYLFSHHIQPALAGHRCWVISHYPASQAALARLDHADPRVALRFEVFIHDMELANGFEELTDAKEQRRRFESDNQVRLARGLKSLPADEEFLDALESGLPPCSGVAVGVDRLFMSLNGISDIRDTLAWPWNKA